MMKHFSLLEKLKELNDSFNKMAYEINNQNEYDKNEQQEKLKSYKTLHMI